MKKFNLFNEIIVVDKKELLRAINSTKEFAITASGEIIDLSSQIKEALIFRGLPQAKQTLSLSLNTTPTLSTVLGSNYQIVEDEDRVLIKAFSNWQEIIGFNIQHASYDDTTSDGVAEFSNKELEDLGWHATEFNISYRELVEILEKSCEGIVLCIEQEEPSYRFSGLGFLSDNADAYKTLFSYCQEKIKKLMQEDEDYRAENLTDDEEDAAKYFKIL